MSSNTFDSLFFEKFIGLFSKLSKILKILSDELFKSFSILCLNSSSNLLNGLDLFRMILYLTPVLWKSCKKQKTDFDTIWPNS